MADAVEQRDRLVLAANVERASSAGSALAEADEMAKMSAG